MEGEYRSNQLNSHKLHCVDSMETKEQGNPASASSDIDESTPHSSVWQVPRSLIFPDTTDSTSRDFEWNSQDEEAEQPSPLTPLLHNPLYRYRFPQGRQTEVVGVTNESTDVDAEMESISTEHLMIPSFERFNAMPSNSSIDVSQRSRGLQVRALNPRLSSSHHQPSLRPRSTSGWYESRSRSYDSTSIEETSSTSQHHFDPDELVILRRHSEVNIETDRYQSGTSDAARGSARRKKRQRCNSTNSMFVQRGNMFAGTRQYCLTSALQKIYWCYNAYYCEPPHERRWSH